MNHGALHGTCHWDLYEPWALQGTCHWDLYEPWGPTRHLSLSLVWTMGPYKVPVTEPCMNHGALQGTCHWHLYEPWGPTRYLSLRLVWTIGPYKVPVTQPCINHGALQGTCHWDLCEPWGPTSYLLLRLVWTMGPSKVPVTETCTNHGVLQNRCTRTGSSFLIMPDGSWWWLSITLFAQFHSWVWQWPEFHFQTDFLHHCHVPTNQPTRPTFCTTSKYRIFSNLTAAAWSRHYLHLQNPTVHHHTHKALHSTQLLSQVNTIHNMNSISVKLS